MSSALPATGFGVRLVGLLAGCIAVFRNEMRRTSPVRDLALSLLLTGLIIGLGYLTELSKNALLNTHRGADMISNWCAVSVTGNCIVMSMLAAVLGASSAPSAGEYEEVQSALLTHLEPFAICAGRLAAGIRIPMASIPVSFAFWLAANHLHGAPPEKIEPFEAVMLAHLGVLLFICMIGAAGFLFAQRAKRGSNRIAGFCAAFTGGLLCFTAIYLINPLLSHVENPGKLIEAALLINPIACVASAFHLDILREEWVYAHIQAHDYMFAYPSAAACCALYSAMALAALLLSAGRLRRVYR